MAKRIKVWLGIGLCGCDKEDVFDAPDDWDDMDQKERDEYLEEAAMDFRNDNIEYGAEVIDDESEAK